MRLVSLHGLNFSRLSWTVKLLPRQHTGTSIWHAR